jgi:hypothetical protein
MKLFLRHIIYFLIQFIETIEYRKLNLDEDDFEKKILDTFQFTETELLVDSSEGWVPIFQVHKTQPYTIHKLVLSNGLSLDCADTHILFDENDKQILLKDLTIGCIIKTSLGDASVVSINKTCSKLTMFDLSVESTEHSYYTNNIKSHNTISTSIFLVHYLCFNYDKNLMILANKGATTKELIDKIKVIIANLPFFLKPGMYVNNEMSMKFDNGCRLFGMNTTKTPAIGFTVHFLYCDEFAHIPENILEPFWKAVFPTISSSLISRVIITSTPNGTNKFYDIYKAALEGKSDFHAIRIDWWQIPGKDENWKAKEIENLGSVEDFNQEYGCQFLAGSKLMLDSKTLRYLKSISSVYEWRSIDELDDLDIDYTGLEWHKKFDLDSITSDNRFVLSIDLADGGGGDYSVINIFKLIPAPIDAIKKRALYTDESDFFSLLQVGRYRSNESDIDVIKAIIEALIYYVLGQDITKIVLEINFDGKRLYDKLESHSKFYQDIFIHTYHNQSDKDKDKLKPGIKLRSNKKDLCLESKKTIKNLRIIPNESKTVGELSGFGRNKKGSFSCQTGHDDLAMTVVNLNVFFESPQFYEMVEEVYDNIDDRIKQEIENKLNNIEDDSNDIDTDFLSELME